MTVTATPMENAAFFAFPSPVSEAESVSIPARNTDERAVIFTRPMSVSLSETDSLEYNKLTTGSENTSRKTANGRERRMVIRSANMARSLPSSALPLAALLETSGTVAATRP